MRMGHAILKKGQGLEANNRMNDHAFFVRQMKGLSNMEKDSKPINSVSITSDVPTTTALTSSASFSRESEEIFRSLVEQSPTGIYLLSLNGIIIEWNQSMERITELKKAEVIGKPMMDVMFSLFREEVRNQQMLERVSSGTRAFIQSGTSARHDVSIENIIQCKSGVRRHIEIILIRVQLESGYITGGLVQDITARKEADAALKRNLSEMTALSTIASKAAVADSLPELVKNTIGIIREVMVASKCYITIGDFEDVSRNPEVFFCDPKKNDTDLTIQNPIIRHILLSGESFRESIHGDEADLHLANKQVSALGIPLYENNMLIGVIYIERPSDYLFNSEDETLLKTIAGQFSVAISKVRLMEKLKDTVSDRTRQLSTLYEILDIANTSKNLEGIIKLSLQKVISVVGSTQGALFLTDENWQISLVASHNISKKNLNLLQKQLSKFNFHSKEERSETTPSEELDCETIRFSGDKAYCYIPLRAQSREMGGVIVPEEDILHLNQENRDLLMSISEQVGITVETFRLRKKAEEAAVLEERERLSRELHDSVTQLLYSLTLFAKTGSEFAARNDLANTQKRLATINEISQQALKEMRLMVYELKPQMLEQDGFELAIRRRLESVEEHLGIKTKLVVHLSKLTPKLERTLYFIIQEALNNVLKHSNANFVTVTLTAENNAIDLLIEDDGVGFSMESIPDKGGLGLANMQKSIKAINGKLEILSSPGQGTTIHVVAAY